MPLNRETIINVGTKLAPSAPIFGRLRALIDDPETQLDELVDMVRLDPALTFHVIRMSNSVLFGLRDRTDSLEGAVGRVGFSEIYRLVGLAATSQVCQRDLQTYRLKASRLWENAVATAAAAEVLAVPAGCDIGLAYASGLLRTIGRVIIDGAAGGNVYPGEAEWPSVNEWEKRTFGVTSDEVAVTLLTHWRFPAILVDSIQRHHAPLAEAEAQVGACVLNLACGVTARFGLDLPGETACWTADPAKLARAGVDEADLETCAARAREHYTALCASVE